MIYSLLLSVCALASVGDALRAPAVSVEMDRFTDAKTSILDLTTRDEELIFVEDSLSSLINSIRFMRSTTFLESHGVGEILDTASDDIRNQIQEIIITGRRGVIINYELDSSIIESLYVIWKSECPECAPPELVQLGSVSEPIPDIPTEIYTRALILVPGESGSVIVFRNLRNLDSPRIKNLDTVVRVAAQVGAVWEEGELKRFNESSMNGFVLDELTSMVIRKFMNLPCENPRRVSKDTGFWDLATENPDWLFIHHIHDIRRMARYLPEDIQDAAGDLFASRHTSTQPTQQLLDALRLVSRQIVQATRNDDLLVFVGNTPSYLYHIVDQVRDSVALPFSSSRWNLDEVDFNTQTFPGLDHYVEVFLKPIFEQKRPILLVDVSMSGATINILYRLMRSRCAECQIEYLQLHIVRPHFFEFPWSPRELKLRQIIFVSDVFEYFLAGYYVRLMPKLSREHWSKASQELVHAYKAQPIQAGIIKTLESLVTAEELLTPFPPERPSPMVNLGEYAEFTPHGGLARHSWLQPDLSIPLIRLTDWFKSSLEKFLNGPNLVMTQQDVDQMEKSPSLASEGSLKDATVEEIAARLTRMTFEFTESKDFIQKWYVKWGPQLMEMIRNYECIRTELGPIAFQLLYAIQVPPESREKFNQVLGLTD